MDGKEFDVDDTIDQFIEDEDNTNPDERLVAERVEENCENYIKNQVLPLIPNKENHLKLK